MWHTSCSSFCGSEPCIWPYYNRKRTGFRFAFPQEIDISEISTETAQTLKSDDSDEGYDTGENEALNVSSKVEKSSFIVSPADIEVHWKATLRSAKVIAEHLAAFEQLCEKYKDIYFCRFFRHRKNTFN